MRFFKYKIHISEEVYLPTKFSQSFPSLPPRFIMEKSRDYQVPIAFTATRARCCYATSSGCSPASRGTRRAVQVVSTTTTCHAECRGIPPIHGIPCSILDGRVLYTATVYTDEISREIRAYRLLSYMNFVGK